MSILRPALLVLCAGLAGCASSRPHEKRSPADEGSARLCRILSKLEIHSHRGAANYPENMLTALMKSAEIGADFVEMDLQVSRDDRLIVAHDAFMKRSCLDRRGRPLPKPVYFRDLPVRKIKTYDCGSENPSGESVPGERISTLEEVMEALKPVLTARGKPLGLNIEIKYNPTQPQFYPPREVYAKLVLEALDRAAYDPSRIMVQSFDVGILMVLRSMRPDLRLSPLLPDAANAAAIAESLATDIVTPHSGQVSPERLSLLQDRGIRVVPWTVNSPEEALRLVGWGVDGVITDRPEIFTSMRERTCAGAHD